MVKYKLKLIKIFIVLILLITSFQSLTKADDISDFEIEGISLGDSALDYFDINEIIKKKENGFVYEKKDFFSATFYEKKFFKNYDSVQLHLKKKDNNYIIYSIGGQMTVENYQDKCFNKMDEVLSSIKNLFPKAEFLDVGIEDWTSPQNKNTKVKSYYLKLKSKDEISIQCYDHPKNSEDFKDTLLIALDSAEFVNWLYD
jgi:patatin-like phospholipase/acyl hydrolase